MIQSRWVYYFINHNTFISIGNICTLIPNAHAHKRTANNFVFLKRISQNSFPNIICIIPKSFTVFCQELHNPKRNYKTRFEPRLPRMSSQKSNKHNILDLSSGPLASEASILPLDHQCWCLILPQSCTCQDPSWGNKSAKPVKVTGKNDSPQ
jgi:hypothetical protein